MREGAGPGEVTDSQKPLCIASYLSPYILISGISTGSLPYSGPLIVGSHGGIGVFCCLFQGRRGRHWVGKKRGPDSSHLDPG